MTDPLPLTGKTLLLVDADEASRERLAAIRPLIGDDEMFMANYGDVLTDAPLDDMVARFATGSAVASFLTVRPRPYTFHLIDLQGDRVAGVLGVVPGILGLLQTNEALKVLLGIGNTLAGRLVLFDALETEFTELQLRRDPNCPVCSDAAVEARKAGRPLQVDGVNVEAPFLMTGSFGSAS